MKHHRTVVRFRDNNGYCAGFVIGCVCVWLVSAQRGPPPTAPAAIAALDEVTIDEDAAGEKDYSGCFGSLTQISLSQLEP